MSQEKDKKMRREGAKCHKKRFYVVQSDSFYLLSVKITFFHFQKIYNKIYNKQSLGVPVSRATQCMRDAQIPQLQFLVFHHTDNHIQVLSLALPSSIHNKEKHLSKKLFLQTHRETDRFLQLQEFNLRNLPVDSLFHFRRAPFSSQLKEKVGSTLVKSVTLSVNLNLDGSPITSRTLTHPSHSPTSRLLTSSISLGVPVPRGTQCM